MRSWKTSIVWCVGLISHSLLFGFLILSIKECEADRERKLNKRYEMCIKKTDRPLECQYIKKTEDE